MSAWGDAIRESWRDASTEILLTLGFGVVGVAGGLLPGVIGVGWSLAIAATAVIGVLLVLLAYRRRKARESDEERTAVIARLVAEDASRGAVAAEPVVGTPVAGTTPAESSTP